MPQRRRLNWPEYADYGWPDYADWWRGLSSSTLVDAAAAGGADRVLSPGVTPVRTPLINGRPLHDNQLAVGASPTLTWLPPEAGTPTHYFARVLELVAIGTRTNFRQVARMTTNDTSLVMPPDILVPGKAYVITVAADTGGPTVPQPNRRSLPFSFATVMSGIISP